jgi:hypothetical protein
MVQLNLETKDAEALARVLQIYLSDLRFEIADTDRMAMRDRLKDEEKEIKAIIEQLATAGVKG